MSFDSPVTVVARLELEEKAAKAVADLFAETFATGEAAVAAYETREGAWAVEIYFETNPDEAAVRALMAAAAGDDAGRAVAFSTVAAKDWVAASLAGLKPVPAGRFLVHGAHDRTCVAPHRVGIEIEAALAFGTGHHGTTRGCLLALDRLVKSCGNRVRRRAPVLDVGTGTGVLAIAAARALRCRVVASDIDARAVVVARANARANRAGPWIDIVPAAGVSASRLRRAGPYAIVLANILLPPLKRMAHEIAALVAPGGYVILSGLLDAQAGAALAAYRGQGLALAARNSLEGWTTLMLVRRVRGRARRAGGR